jgi:hypothetical protein
MTRAASQFETSFIPNRGCDFRFWHLASFRCAAKIVAYWTNNGQKAALGLDLSAAIDPTATLAVHCGNDFYTGFSPY